MFDWVEFSPDRLAQPIVITGLILMIVGFVGVLSARYIGTKIENKGIKNATTYTYLFTALLTVVGIFMAVLGAK
mgnify:CR=1 FL=1